MLKHLIKVRAKVVQDVSYLVEVDGDLVNESDAADHATRAVACAPAFLYGRNRKSHTIEPYQAQHTGFDANPDDVDLRVTVKGDMAFILEP